MKKTPVSLALVAALSVGSLATAASAQDYRGYGYGNGYRNGYASGRYDDGRNPCQEVQHNRGTNGAILGALAGAAIGSNMAAHHGGRTGGALLGALAGAMIGHQIGVENSPPPAQCTARYDGPPPPGADRDYDERRADADESDRLPPPPRGDAGASTDGCRLADSPIHMPDGSTEQRYVRVCPDGNGRYRVVD